MSVLNPEAILRRGPRVRGQFKPRIAAFWEPIPLLPPSPKLLAIDLYSWTDRDDLEKLNGAPAGPSEVQIAKSEKSKEIYAAAPGAEGHIPEVRPSIPVLSSIPECNPDPVSHEINLYSRDEVAESPPEVGSDENDSDGEDEHDPDEDESNGVRKSDSDKEEGSVANPPSYIESIESQSNSDVDSLELKQLALQQSQTPASATQSNPSLPLNNRYSSHGSGSHASGSGSDEGNKQQAKSLSIPSVVKSSHHPQQIDSSSSGTNHDKTEHGRSEQKRPALAPQPREASLGADRKQYVHEGGKQRALASAIKPVLVEASSQSHRSGPETGDGRPPKPNVVDKQPAPPPAPTNSTAKSTSDLMISTGGSSNVPPMSLVTGSPVEIDNPTLLTVDTRVLNVESRLFALVIGINQYEDKNLETLHGAVRDADSFRYYFEDELHVSGNRIIALFDEQATRANIVDAFEKIARIDEIRKGDPIVIFYAGQASKGANFSGANLQMLLPFDFSGDTTSAITNRQMEKFMANIARKKGDNITLILSCSHSGSFTSANSHMLLAACGASEKATEANGRGVFSLALFNFLKTRLKDKPRFCDVLPGLDTVSGQNPQCLGKNQYRVIFGTEIVPPRRSYSVRPNEGNKREAIINAGFRQGITVKARFTFYLADDFEFKRPLGGAIVKSVQEFFAVVDKPSNIDLSQSFVAVQSEAGRKDYLRIFLPSADTPYALVKIIKESVLHGIISVEDRNTAHLRATLSGENVSFELADRRVAQYGYTPQFGPLNINDQDRLTWSLIRMAHFFSELNGISSSNSRNTPIRFEFYALEWSEEDDLKPGGSNFCRNGAIDIAAGDHEIPYGMKLINESPYDLYPYLFLYSCTDLSIKDYYLSPGLPDSPYAHDVPLPKGNGILPIGYGFGGGNYPFYFNLKDGQNVNVSFIKLIFSSKPIDLLHIPQSSPFEAERNVTRLPPSQHIQFIPRQSLSTENMQKETWGSVVIPVIQRRYSKN